MADYDREEDYTLCDDNANKIYTKNSRKFSDPTALSLSPPRLRVRSRTVPYHLDEDADQEDHVVTDEEDGPFAAQAQLTERKGSLVLVDTSPRDGKRTGFASDQCDRVVECFMISAYHRDIQSEAGDGARYPSTSTALTPHIPELSLPNVNPLSQEALIGARLARIGDEINAKYGREFDRMADGLISAAAERTFRNAFDTLRKIGKRIFKGGISWGRIAAFLSFGYRLAVSMFCNGVQDFMSQIVHFVSAYIVTERISEWIACVGGWPSVLKYDLSQENGNGIGLYIAGTMVAIGVIALLTYLRRR